MQSSRVLPGAHCSCCLQSTVGCVVPTTDPNILLAALGSNVVEVNVQNRKTGRIVAFVSTDDNAEGTRFNDGKATPQGVFIVGRMNRLWREGQPGKLFAMDLRVPGNSFGLLTILGPTEVRLSSPPACAMFLRACFITSLLLWQGNLSFASINSSLQLFGCIGVACANSEKEP